MKPVYHVTFQSNGNTFCTRHPNQQFRSLKSARMYYDAHYVAFNATLWELGETMCITLLAYTDEEGEKIIASCETFPDWDNVEAWNPELAKEMARAAAKKQGGTDLQRERRQRYAGLMRLG